MNNATRNAQVDARAKRDHFSAEFYNTGIRYIIALDEWIASQKQESTSDPEVAAARGRRHLIETFLRRLYSDEFADTCSE